VPLWSGGGSKQGNGHRDVGDVSRREGNRSAAIIRQSMDFARSSVARTANRFRELPLFELAAERCALTWLLSMESSSGTGSAAAIFSKMRCQATLRPPIVAVVDGRRRPIGWRNVAPAASCFQHMQDAGNDGPIVDARFSWLAARQMGLQRLPCLIRQPELTSASNDSNHDKKIYHGINALYGFST
jgi:hypothetical protein